MAHGKLERVVGCHGVLLHPKGHHRKLDPERMERSKYVQTAPASTAHQEEALYDTVTGLTSFLQCQLPDLSEEWVGKLLPSGQEIPLVEEVVVVYDIPVEQEARALCAVVCQVDREAVVLMAS